MKKAKSRTELAILEHVTFIIFQTNQDASGEKPVNLTYYSIRKKITQTNENTGKLMLNDSEVTEKNTCCDRRKEQKAAGKFTQLNLFPNSKQQQ